MPAVRKIIHIDLDAFFCAVEEQLDPSLRGKAFAVGGSPESRGVVASCSYKARQYGVRSAMPMARAVQLCPELMTRFSQHAIYRRKSKEVMKILRDHSSLMEQISIDEAFLDVSEDDRLTKIIGAEIQNNVLKDTGLSCSLGISTNKLIAKIATDIGKSKIKTDTYPQAMQIIPPGREASFIASLPTRALWGIGEKTAIRLSNLGMHTIGDIANWPEADMQRHFGKLGLELVKRASGLDDREVISIRETKSISQEVTFSKDVMNEQVLLLQIEKQAQSISNSLKKGNLQGSTIKLKLRWPDFSTISRQITLPQPTDEYKVILDTAKTLFYQNWKTGIAIRLLGVGVSGFHKANPQYNLWDAPKLMKAAELEDTIDQLKKRFGDKTIKRGLDD